MVEIGDPLVKINDLQGRRVESSDKILKRFILLLLDAYQHVGASSLSVATDEVGDELVVELFKGVDAAKAQP